MNNNVIRDRDCYPDRDLDDFAPCKRDKKICVDMDVPLSLYVIPPWYW